MNDINLTIRKVFVKDTGLPIKVLESPYFEYFLDLYESTLKAKTLWGRLQKEIRENYNEKPGLWMEESRKLREKVIDDIVSTPGYQNFNTSKKLDSLLETTPGEVKKELYSGGNDGRKFLSIDLRGSNFQSLKWYDPEIFRGSNTWEEFLGKYTNSEHIKESKNTRQVIFGNTNPGRIVRVERYLVWKISELVSSFLPPIFSRSTDELLFQLPDDFLIDGDLEARITEIVKESLGIDIRVTVFTIRMIQRFTHSGVSVLGFIKDFTWPHEKPSELKGTPGIYYPQIYKAWKGMDLNPTYDLVLSYEGELARFDYPLTIINPNGK